MSMTFEKLAAFHKMLEEDPEGAKALLDALRKAARPALEAAEKQKLVPCTMIMSKRDFDDLMEWASEQHTPV